MKLKYDYHIADSAQTPHVSVYDAHQDELFWLHHTPRNVEIAIEVCRLLNSAEVPNAS